MVDNNSIGKKKRIIDTALKAYLAPTKKYNSFLYNIMRYAIFSGGKRFRPILLLMCNELCDGKSKEAIPAACAIEMIHAFSLIQDDLPMMDDDDIRRGKASCHKKFGEAAALLAGDALLALAFELLAETKSIVVVREVSRAIGYRGMALGQFIDLKEKGRRHKICSIKNKMFKKTTSLIAASAKIGGILANARSSKLNSLYRYGEYLGFSYQLFDDLQDKEHVRKTDVLAKLQILKRKIGNEADFLGKNEESLIKFANYVVFDRLHSLTNLDEG